MDDLLSCKMLLYVRYPRVYRYKMITTVRGVHITLKDRNELGGDNKHDTNGWVNLSVINVSIESFLQYPDEPT